MEESTKGKLKIAGSAVIGAFALKAIQQWGIKAVLGAALGVGVVGWVIVTAVQVAVVQSKKPLTAADPSKPIGRGLSEAMNEGPEGSAGNQNSPNSSNSGTESAPVGPVGGTGSQSPTGKPSGGGTDNQNKAVATGTGGATGEAGTGGPGNQNAPGSGTAPSGTGTQSGTGASGNTNTGNQNAPGGGAPGIASAGNQNAPGSSSAPSGTGAQSGTGTQSGTGASGNTNPGNQNASGAGGPGMANAGNQNAPGGPGSVQTTAAPPSGPNAGNTGSQGGAPPTKPLNVTLPIDGKNFQFTGVCEHDKSIWRALKKHLQEHHPNGISAKDRAVLIRLHDRIKSECACTPKPDSSTTTQQAKPGGFRTIGWQRSIAPLADISDCDPPAPPKGPPAPQAAAPPSGPPEDKCFRIWVLQIPPPGSPNYSLGSGSVWVGTKTELQNKLLCQFPGGGPCVGAGLEPMMPASSFTINPKIISASPLCLPSPQEAQAAWCKEFADSYEYKMAANHGAKIDYAKQFHVLGGKYWTNLAPSCPTPIVHAEVDKAMTTPAPITSAQPLSPVVVGLPPAHSPGIVIIDKTPPHEPPHTKPAVIPGATPTPAPLPPVTAVQPGVSKPPGPMPTKPDVILPPKPGPAPSATSPAAPPTNPSVTQQCTGGPGQYTCSEQTCLTTGGRTNCTTSKAPFKCSAGKQDDCFPTAPTIKSATPPAAGAPVMPTFKPPVIPPSSPVTTVAPPGHIPPPKKPDVILPPSHVSPTKPTVTTTTPHTITPTVVPGPKPATPPAVTVLPLPSVTPPMPATKPTVTTTTPHTITPVVPGPKPTTPLAITTLPSTHTSPKVIAPVVPTVPKSIANVPPPKPVAPTAVMTKPAPKPVTTYTTASQPKVIHVAPKPKPVTTYTTASQPKVIHVAPKPKPVIPCRIVNGRKVC